jgi:hypothetical protein
LSMDNESGDPTAEYVSIVSRYDTLSADREMILDRARTAARYTLPYMFPPTGINQTSRLPVPWQSVCAKAVTHLTARIVLVLTSPGTPYFKLALTPSYLKDIDKDTQKEFETALSNAATLIMQQQESRAERVTIHECVKHLIVAGNGLLYEGPKSLKFFPLSQYCVVRDGEGNLVEVVIKESLTWQTLPPDMGDDVKQKIKSDYESEHEGKDVDAEPLELYTRAVKTGPNKWEEKQEICGCDITGEPVTYTDETFPYLALRWNRIDGEHYGRSLCEEHLGDIRAIEALSMSLIRYAKKASKLLMLVSPNGQTAIEDLQGAADGAYVPGLADDVVPLILNKTADLNVAAQMLDKLVNRLETAFLVASSIQRDAERQTATEWKLLASELENAFSGVYSTLALELQRPKVSLTIQRMIAKKELPPLPTKLVNLSIVTGIDALGRNEEASKMDAFVSMMINQFGTNAIASMKVEDYMRGRAALGGINFDIYLKTPEERQAEQQQAQQQSLLEKAAGPGVTAIGRLQQASMANQEPQ